MKKLSVFTFIQHMLKLLFSLVFLSCYGTVFGLVCIIRAYVQIGLNILYGSGAYVLAKGIDALFGYNKVPGSSAIIHTTLVIKGYPDVRRIQKWFRMVVFQYTDNNGRAIYRDRLQKVFCSKFGFSCWKSCSESFDISRHIHFIEKYVEDTYSLVTEDKLLTTIGELMDEQTLFDNQHPQWEIIIVPNYQASHPDNDGPLNDPHFACIVRVHHAYADGASFGILIDSVLSEAPIKYAVDPFKPPKGFSKSYNFLLQLYSLAFGPWDFAMTLTSALMDNSCWMTDSSGYSNRKITQWTPKIHMDYLKKIKHTSGASIAAILLAALSGSMKKFHERKHQENSSRFRKPPEPFVNFANMGIMLPYTSREFQNHFTTVNMKVHLENSTVISRLKSIDRLGREISQSSQPLFNYLMMQTLGYFPRVVQNLVSEIAGTPALFSNVPGALEPFSMFGGCVKDIGAWLPMVKTYGVAAATFSHCGYIRVCLTTDAFVMQNHEVKWFLNQISAQIDLMAEYYDIRKPKYHPNSHLSLRTRSSRTNA